MGENTRIVLAEASYQEKNTQDNLRKKQGIHVFGYIYHVYIESFNKIHRDEWKLGGS